VANLRFLAGPVAMQTLKQQGLRPQLFTQLLAASGGPKYLAIAGLDKYLFGEFFKQRRTPLYTLGASSGAWRLACLAQRQPLEAYGRLEDEYIGQRYETRPSPDEVSSRVKAMIRGILGADGAAELVDNEMIKTHFIVCRGRHLNRMPGRLPLALGLGLTAGANLLSRRTLGWHFERLVFSQQAEESPFAGLRDLPSRQARLTRDNLDEVMLATGSIPWVLAPVKRITGVAPGHYYDGGITDYHLDLPLSHAPGLTLYPHFSASVTPGWFDKALGWRRAGVNYANALVLAPTPEFIASLPYGKLPDRDDFRRLDTNARMQYWREASRCSELLADELATVIASGNVVARLEPF
jgi:hypothetical protein